MTHLNTILRRVRWRMMANLALDRAAWGLLSGAVAGCIIAVIDRGFEGIVIPHIVYWIMCAAGAAAGAVNGLLSAPRREGVAASLDAKMALKNRLATAQAIDAGRVPPSEFAPIVQQDAERAAERIHARAAAPLRVSRMWAGAGAAALAMVATVAYLPEFARAANGSSETDPESLSELTDAREAAAVALDESLAQLRESQAIPADADDLAALDKLAAQMRGNEVPPQNFAAARDEAAERLEQLSQRLAEQAEHDEKVLDNLNERFAGLQSEPSPEQTSPTAEFQEALRRGDYAQAAEAVENLSRSLDEMSPAERALAVEELRRLQERLDAAGAESETQGDADEAALRERLREQGVDEEVVDELLPENESNYAEPRIEHDGEEIDQQESSTQGQTESDVAERLQQEGMDREAANRLAEEVMRDSEEQNAREEADQLSDDLADSMRDLADEIDQQREPAPNQDPQERDAENQEPSQPNADSNQESGENQQPPQERQPQEQQSGTREQQTQPCPECEGGGCEACNGTGVQPKEGAAENPGATNEAEGEGGESDRPREGARPGEGVGEPADRPGPPTGASDRSDRGANDPDSAPSNADSTAPQTGGNDEQSARERVSESLRELEERARRGDDAREQSEQMREAARDVAEQLTPEEQEQLRQWAEEFERQDDESERADQRPAAGDPTAGRGGHELSQREPLEDFVFEDAENVDLRDETGDQRTLAEWLVNERPEGEPLQTTEPSSGAMARHAERAAERAVNEGAVPRRYHDFVRRYFGRLRQTIEEAEKGEE